VPERVPHRWKGRGLFDDIGMIQRVKTALTRQMLDNLYLQNHPMLEVVQNMVVNPAALSNRKIGQPIFVKAPGSIEPQVIPFVADKAFTALEYMDRVRAQRTGVSEQSMGLDPDALQNETATAVQARQAAQFARVELITRNFAEMGLKDLFRLLLRLLVKYQEKPDIIRLRNNWVPMDPSVWNADMDCVVNVGLGSGSKDRDMANLGAIAQKQEAIVERAGPANPVVNIAHLVKTYQRLAEASGIRNAESYFPDVTPEVIKQLAQQAQQNPDAMKQQGDMQMARAKMAMEQQKAQRDAQLEQEKLQRQATIEQQQGQADLAVQQQKAQLEMEIAKQKYELEKQLKLLDAGLRVRKANADDPNAPDEIITPEDQRNDSLVQALAQMAQGLHAFAQSHAAPKRAVKMQDGSFVMQPVPQAPIN
jgi:hypothetical protein